MTELDKLIENAQKKPGITDLLVAYEQHKKVLDELLEMIEDTGVNRN